MDGQETTVGNPQETADEFASFPGGLLGFRNPAISARLLISYHVVLLAEPLETCHFLEV